MSPPQRDWINKGLHMLNTNLRKIIAVGAVVVLLLVEFSMFRDFFYPFRFLWEEGKVVELFLSLVLLLWCVIGVFFVFFSGRSLLRKITLPIFLFFFLFNVGSYNIANSPIDFQQSTLIVGYFQWWFWAVVENYGLAALPLLILLVPVIVFVERLPELSKINFPKQAYFVPLSAVIFTFIGLQSSDGFVDRYPSFFRVPSMLVYASQSYLYDGQRSAVSYSEDLTSQVDKIVLIVDESIRADILGINAYKKDTTPYLSSLKAGMVNFGEAAASTNCSDYSNLILRTGLKKGEIPDQEQMSLKEPSIWQYMRKAGYHNVYLDAQSKEEWENYQDYMNENEALFIDNFFRLRQQVAYESDGLAREKLIRYLKQPGKTFILLNKYGLHFPYFRSYPEAYNIYKPALKQGESMDNREKALNSYMNGLRWAVDDWFKGMFSESGDFQTYVIIYTSDHGQNIVDDGTLATHCRPRANRFEGIVPMVVFSNAPGILEKFKSVQKTSYNETSHFQIIPTLLRLAGYNDSWVRGHYGASLSEPPGTRPEFFTGDLHGRGSIRQWNPIFPSETKSD